MKHKASELVSQSKEELSALLTELDKERYHLQCELKVNRKLEKPHRLKELRKAKARIMTVMRGKS